MNQIPFILKKLLLKFTAVRMPSHDRHIIRFTDFTVTVRLPKWVPKYGPISKHHILTFSRHTKTYVNQIWQLIQQGRISIDSSKAA